MGIFKSKTLESWIDVAAKMKTAYGITSGCVKYGIRIPPKPGPTSLYELQPNSREKIKGVKPHYWFINHSQSKKIRLVIAFNHNDKLKGIGRDNLFFRYTIKRDSN